jgi:hypothetical protein
MTDRHINSVEDERKTGLKNGLKQLSVEELLKVFLHPEPMVLDTYNYEDGKFCPLAVALGLTDMADPSHEKVYQELTRLGYKVNNTRGIKGDFYTMNRLDDLLEATEEVLYEKLQDKAA